MVQILNTPWKALNTNKQAQLHIYDLPYLFFNVEFFLQKMRHSYAVRTDKVNFPVWYEHLQYENTKQKMLLRRTVAEFFKNLGTFCKIADEAQIL